MRSLHSSARTASLMLALCVAGSGCRGWTSDQPPVHLNPNMDTQDKYKAYRASDFFADGRTMRAPPSGTVARTAGGRVAQDSDYLRVDDAYYLATADNAPIPGLPDALRPTPALLERGQQRYNIYCAPCHARHGNGEGTVASRLRIKPPTFHDDVRLGQSVAHFYRIITHGKPLPEDRTDLSVPLNMPSYQAQIGPEDRWAIALYVRTLQQTQYTAGTLPLQGLGNASTSEAGEGAPNEGSTP